MSNTDAVIRSLEIIERCISEKLTAEDIAGGVFFSKYHYQRMFRDIVGEGVMEYVKKRRLTLAGTELVQTDASVLDTALKFGYGSHEAFTRAFKSYMGVTPSDCTLILLNRKLLIHPVFQGVWLSSQSVGLIRRQPLVFVSQVQS